MIRDYDAVIAGAGFAGAVSARKLAEAGKKVLILEKRNHIGGNAYDYCDENHVLRHEYGPHIFHTNSEKAVAFLSRFTDWFDYEHRVLGWIEGRLVPIPFNLTSIEMLFEKEKADHLKSVLISAYGMGKKVPILELRKNPDPEINELAEYIFEHVFKYYTMKQWGYTAEEIDPAVTARVPVLVSYDDRYFQDSFQKMPKDGYTAIFEKMLDHPNITVRLNTDAADHITVDTENKKVLADGEPYDGIVIYTGLADHLLKYCLGDLSYRSLEFDVQSHDGDYQPATTVNYPTSAEIHPYTRISEYKKMMFNPPAERTTVAVEYPYVYNRTGEKGNVPYYPVFTEESKGRYQAYTDLLKGISNLYLLGRLAEYRYYNMDAIVERALEFTDEILKH
ncbi:MAG: UDP-galactopyranose mutase [Solobacterium sp.]|nr:UDP-galactopyranose mutase [Solobacterium sp.]